VKSAWNCSYPVPRYYGGTLSCVGGNSTFRTGRNKRAPRTATRSGRRHAERRRSTVFVFANITRRGRYVLAGYRPSGDWFSFLVTRARATCISRFRNSGNLPRSKRNRFGKSRQGGPDGGAVIVSRERRKRTKKKISP